MEKHIDEIAKMLTDDPDIMEMAVGTGGIAMGPGVPLKTRKRRKTSEDDSEVDDKKYEANPITGKPEKGEVLYSDTQSEETEEPVN